MKEDHSTTVVNYASTTDGVQISVIDLLTRMLYDLHNRTAELQEMSDNQADQIGTLEQDLHVYKIANKEAHDVHAAAGDTIRAQADSIAELSGELESTRNALNARGNTIDALRKQLDEATAKSKPEEGDTVRILEGAKYRTLGGGGPLADVAPGAVGHEGKINYTYSDGTLVVSIDGATSGGYLVLPEYVEVIS